jgi:type IV secretion system protein TrbF
MRFKRASVRYSTMPLPETPYQAAGQLWDERLGSARVQARSWRWAAFGALVLAGLLAVGLLWEAARAVVTPYVVEINHEGEVRSIGAVSANYRPTDAQIGYQLARFVRDVRSLPLDPIVLRENWLEAYHYVSARGAMVLNEYARARDPFGRVGKESIAVEVTSVVRASESSFQLRWIERSYLNGSPASTQHWTAILSTVLRTPQDEAALRANPLGVFVEGLDWTRELESP